MFGRASGGYVAPGQVVRINEQGGRQREYLRAGAGGANVIPTGQTGMLSRAGGGTTVVQHISVDARNSVNPAGFERRILSQANSFASQAAVGGYRQAIQDTPGSLGQFETLKK